MGAQDRPDGRNAPIDLDAEDFRRRGHDVVDEIADFLRTLPGRRVTPGESVDEVRAALGRGGLPEQGVPADRLLGEAGRLLFEHSTLNGHPRFFAYITSSAAPIWFSLWYREGCPLSIDASGKGPAAARANNSLSLVAMWFLNASSSL
jgi:hypothetical protein